MNEMTNSVYLVWCVILFVVFEYERCGGGASIPPYDEEGGHWNAPIAEQSAATQQWWHYLSLFISLTLCSTQALYNFEASLASQHALVWMLHGLCVC